MVPSVRRLVHRRRTGVASLHGLTTTLDHYIIAAAVAIIVYCLLAEIGGLYRSWRGVSAHREAVGVLFGWGCTLVMLLALGFVTHHTAEFSRISMLAWFVATPVLIVASRIITRWIQQILLVVGLQHAGSSPSSASTSWASNWPKTSRPRRTWG